MKKVIIAVMLFAAVLFAAKSYASDSTFIFHDSMPVKNNNFAMTVKLMLNKSILAYTSDMENMDDKKTKIENWLIAEDSNMIVSNIKFITSTFIKSARWNANVYFIKRNDFIYVEIKDIVTTDGKALGEHLNFSIAIEDAAKTPQWRQHVTKAKQIVNYTFDRWKKS